MPDISPTLLNLLAVSSPSGFEAQGQAAWAQFIKPWADEIANDAYGNTWATLRGSSSESKILLAAHCDEIGFMIQNITDDGFIYLIRIGGSDRTIARGKRLRFLGDRGPVIGVIGNTAAHLREKDEDRVPEVHHLFVDIGARNRAEVEASGLRAGHPAVFVDEPGQLLNGRFTGRGIDNRVSGFVLTQVFQRLRERAVRTEATLIALNTVQEEVGGYGARMAAFRFEPSVAIVLDVTHATDSPGIDKNRHGNVKLGGGPTVSHGSANHPRLVEELIRIGQKLGLSLQHEATSTSTRTDTDLIFSSRTGVPSALVSVPLRYMHSTVETVDLVDIEQTVELLMGFVTEFDLKTDLRPPL
ncbi:MAG: M20/M25/M40 family metallo-hydrolase [Verrucomicrobia bacterium]|nr:M20/M25/M40 family metallo-hydrolase [Verrucomicrobiota bacterium]